jgi:uncharacterized protein
MGQLPEPQVVRDFYAAIEDKSVERVAGLLDPDVIWHVPGQHSRAGIYRGRDQIMALFDGFSRADQRQSEVEDILCGKRFVMALIHITERKGVPYDGRYIHVIRTNNGRIAESWHYDEDQSRLDQILEEES